MAETATARRRNRPSTRMPGNLRITPRRRPRTTTLPGPRTMRSTGRPRIMRMSSTIRHRRRHPRTVVVHHEETGLGALLGALVGGLIGAAL